MALVAKLVEWMNRLRFRTLINFFTGGIIVGTLLLQVYYVEIVHETLRENDAGMVREACVQVAGTAADLAAQLDRVGLELAFNKMALDVTSSENAWEWLVHSKQIYTAIHAIRLSSDIIDNVFFTDLDRLVLGYGSEREFGAITRMHALIQSGALAVDRPQHVRIGDERYYLCSSMRNETTDRQFYVLIHYNLDSIQSKMAVVQREEAMDFVLIGGQGEWLCGNGEQAQRLYEQYSRGARLEDICPDGVAIEQRIDGTDWRLIAATAQRRSEADYWTLKTFALLTTATLVVLTAAASYAMKRSIAMPVQSMISYMQGIVESRRYQPLKVIWHNELGELADTMNVMLRHLEESNRKTAETKQMLYLAELDKKQLKINALYSQINPHFLYNTLDCIRSIALVNGQQEIADMTESMARIFRYSIKSADKVTVGAEIRCIQEYLRIIQIRHMYSYRIEIDVEPQTQYLMIPKLILQPIVENAVFHGLEQMRSGGALAIRGWTEGERLMLEVEDNGKGMPGEQMDELQKRLQDETLTVGTLFEGRRSIGLININARIRMAYGSRYGVQIMPKVGAGTCVRLCLRKEMPPDEHG